MTSQDESKDTFLSRFREDTQIGSVDFIKIWRNYDKDRNGYLESKEIEMFLEDLMKEKGVKIPDKAGLEEYKKVMLQHFDVNKDGKLGIGELSQLLPVEQNFMAKFECRESLSREQFNDIFNHYDADGSGYLAGDELVALIRDILQEEGQNFSPENLATYVQAILEICDKNQDGKLYREDIGLFLSTT